MKDVILTYKLELTDQQKKSINRAIEKAESIRDSASAINTVLSSEEMWAIYYDAREIVDSLNELFVTYEYITPRDSSAEVTTGFLNSIGVDLSKEE